MYSNARRLGIAAIGGLGLLALVAAPAARSEEKKPAKVDFVKEVKPVLEAACVKCHGPKDPKGRFRLDMKANAFKGGQVALKQKRAGIVPGKADDSLLIVFIEATQKDEAKKIEPMPPGKEQRRLSEDEKALLRRWVAEGARWPDGVTLAPPDTGTAPGGGRRRNP